MSSVQIGNILKNHELRMKAIENNTYVTDDVFSSVKEDIVKNKEECDKINSVSDTLDEYSKKLTLFESKYNELLELFALQHKEYLELKEEMKTTSTKSTTTEEATTEEATSTEESTTVESTTEDNITLDVQDDN